MNSKVLFEGRLSGGVAGVVTLFPLRACFEARLLMLLVQKETRPSGASVGSLSREAREGLDSSPTTYVWMKFARSVGKGKHFFQPGALFFGRSPLHLLGMVAMGGLIRFRWMSSETAVLWL